jgi:hypothetical protein
MFLAMRPVSRFRPGAAGRTWRRFRGWRQSRPFWGGLFLVLSAVEIFLTTQLSLGGLSFQLGPTGFLSWLIPTILLACGLLAWVTPAQHLFYAVVAAVTAVFSLIGINLGGFFVGLILGIAGAGLVFAWTPGQAAGRPTALPTQRAPDATADVDELEGPTAPESRLPGLGDPTDDPVRPDSPSHRLAGSAYDRRVAGGGEAAESRRREGPRLYSVIAFLLVLGVGAALAARAGTPAYAAAPCPTPTKTPPAASPTASPSPSSPAPEKRRRGILGEIIDGITGIFDGDPDEEQAPGAVPSPGPSAKPTPPAEPKPGACAAEDPDEDKGATAVPLLDPDPNVPDVNSRPSVLTGTKLTMWGLRLDGIYVLHTAAGDVRSLKFTMSRSLVKTFALRVPQQAGAPLLIESDTLTVRGDVAFYTSRFVGRIAGIKLTLTPDSPLPPDGISLTIPRIDFDDPRIDLMYVSCDQLLAPTLDESFVSAAT